MRDETRKAFSPSVIFFHQTPFRRVSILRVSHTRAHAHIRTHTVAFRVIRALQRLIAPLPIICSWLYGVPRNKRPAMLHYRSRTFCDIVQGQRRRGPGLRDRPVVEGEKGMLLYVVDINGYTLPPPRGINATITYRHNARLTVRLRVHRPAHCASLLYMRNIIALSLLMILRSSV